MSRHWWKKKGLRTILNRLLWRVKKKTHLAFGRRCVTITKTHTPSLQTVNRWVKNMYKSWCSVQARCVCVFDGQRRKCRLILHLIGNLIISLDLRARDLWVTVIGTASTAFVLPACMCVSMHVCRQSDESFMEWNKVWILTRWEGRKKRLSEKRRYKEMKQHRHGQQRNDGDAKKKKRR